MEISQRQLEKIRIISAFRKYTRLGLSSSALSPFDAYERIRGVCVNKESANDLLAVYDTMRFLKILGKGEVIKAVRAVYFDTLRNKPKKNEISSRVIRYAYENHCDERTVYRQLEYARKIYKLIREKI